MGIAESRRWLPRVCPWGSSCDQARRFVHRSRLDVHVCIGTLYNSLWIGKLKKVVLLEPCTISCVLFFKRLHACTHSKLFSLYSIVESETFCLSKYLNGIWRKAYLCGWTVSNLVEWFNPNQLKQIVALAFPANSTNMRWLCPRSSIPTRVGQMPSWVLGCATKFRYKPRLPYPLIWQSRLKRYRTWSTSSVVRGVTS